MVYINASTAVKHHIDKFLKMFEYPACDWNDFNYQFKQPVVWFGLYNANDYLRLRYHEGASLIYWLGSDVTILLEEGCGQFSPNYLQQLLISKNAIHVCETEQIRDELQSVGIKALVRPFFLGHLEEFQNCYHHAERPSVYTMRSGRDFKFYGIPWIYEIADQVDVDFHIYGHEDVDLPNVFHYPYLSEEEFNNRIKSHQAFLRLPEHDGFSQSTMKAILLGQYVAERTPYDFVTHVSSPLELLDFLNTLSSKIDSNQEVNKLKAVLNNFDWLEEFVANNPIIEREEDEW